MKDYKKTAADVQRSQTVDKGPDPIMERDLLLSDHNPRSMPKLSFEIEYDHARGVKGF